MEQVENTWFLGFAAICVFIVGACSSKEEPIACITSYDCPDGWSCVNNQCVESTDTTVFPEHEATGESDQIGIGDGNESSFPDDVMFDGADETVDEDEQIADDDASAVLDEVADSDEEMADADETPFDNAPDVTPDATPDTTPDTTSDVTPDTDIITDTLPDTDTIPANPGTTCTSNADCHGGTVCAEVFMDQLTSYCHYNCAAPNETICNGTSWPDCSVVGMYAICLDLASIVGNFTAKVGSFQIGNNVNLTISGTSNIQQACTAGKNSSNMWVLQCSRIIQVGPPKIQLDALFFWPETSHKVGTVSGAEGQVFEVTYDASNKMIDNWMRAFFLDTDGTLILTQAGTANGTTVAGSLNFTGNAYNAQFAPQ